MHEINLKDKLKGWQLSLRKYQKPNNRKAAIQLLNSFLPFLGLWVLMYLSLDWHYLITLGLAAVAGFFLVRIFVIQHDCGHQSFLKSRKWNHAIGFFSSFFSSIPYRYWSGAHNEHHAHNGLMEQQHRGKGDIYFLTTDEYRKSTWWNKLVYRIFRSPLVLFFFAPIIYLSISVRYPFVQVKGWKQIRWLHLANNLLVAAVYGTLAAVLGWRQFLLVHVPVLLVFGSIAFWFFYIQHQHEENYKEWKGQWDHLAASIRGSTYYKLPKLFQWLSGNIGFHHIHHLNSSIPNYHLAACARENPQLNEFAHTLTFRQSLKCIQHKLWDAEQQRMVSFQECSRMAGEGNSQEAHS